MNLPAASDGKSCKCYQIDEVRSVRKLLPVGGYYHGIISITLSNRPKRAGFKPPLRMTNPAAEQRGIVVL